MAFPSPSLVPPALNLWEISFGGLKFGGITPGSVYQFQNMDVDMPDVTSGDVQRALDQGEFIGLDTLPGADITVVQAVSCGSYVGPAGATLAQQQTLQGAAQALGGVMGPGGVTETPLWFQTPNGTYTRMCRARKHNCPLDINRVYAGATVATTLLHSTDPRWYAAPSVSQSVGIPSAPGGGLSVAPAVPWALAGGSVGGLLTVVNSGPFESRPVLTFTGPLTNPVATNSSLSGAPFIGVTLTLAAGDTVVIDLDWQSVVYTVAGTTMGAPRRNALMGGATWWNLPANSSNQIAFTSADTSAVAGTLAVTSASAYLSI